MVITENSEFQQVEHLVTIDSITISGRAPLFIDPVLPESNRDPSLDCQRVLPEPEDGSLPSCHKSEVCCILPDVIPTEPA